MLNVCDQLFGGKLLQNFMFKRIKIENGQGLGFRSSVEGGCIVGRAQPSAVPFTGLWTGVTGQAGPGREVTAPWPEQGCEHRTPPSGDSAHPRFSHPFPELLVKRSALVCVRVLEGAACGRLSQYKARAAGTLASSRVPPALPQPAPWHL